SQITESLIPMVLHSRVILTFCFCRVVSRLFICTQVDICYLIQHHSTYQTLLHELSQFKTFFVQQPVATQHTCLTLSSSLRTHLAVCFQLVKPSNKTLTLFICSSSSERLCCFRRNHFISSG